MEYLLYIINRTRDFLIHNLINTHGILFKACFVADATGALRGDVSHQCGCSRQGQSRYLNSCLSRAKLALSLWHYVSGGCAEGDRMKIHYRQSHSMLSI